MVSEWVRNNPPRAGSKAVRLAFRRDRIVILTDPVGP